MVAGSARYAPFGPLKSLLLTLVSVQKMGRLDFDFATAYELELELELELIYFT